jgi:hypothetical protein
MASTKKPTPDHLAALAKGREAGRAMRAYLNTLDTSPKKRGRRANWQSKLEMAQAVLADSEDPIDRLKAAQDVIDAQAALEAREAAGNTEDAEAGFVTYGAWYAEQHGISYSAWRQIGVPASMLKRAGITR